MPALLQRAALNFNIHSNICSYVRGALIHWQEELVKSLSSTLDLGLPTALACLKYWGLRAPGRVLPAFKVHHAWIENKNIKKQMGCKQLFL